MITLVKLYLSRFKNDKKPTQANVGSISMGILDDLVDLTIPNLATELTNNGRTAVLGVLEEGHSLSRLSPIVSQELIMLDFDNKNDNLYSIDECLADPFIQANALFLYKTFSHKNGFDRFRVVFKLDKVFTTNKAVEDVYASLFQLFPYADTTCRYTSRLFYGSNKGFIEVDFNNTLDSDWLLENYAVSEITQPVVKSSTDLKFINANLPDSDYKVWELFRLKKYDVIRERMGDRYSKIYASKAQAQIQSKMTINIIDFFELPKINMFHDIFHDEVVPSANVFIHKSAQTYLYKCFSNSKPYCADIVGLISRLTGTGIFNSLDILLYVTSSVVDNDSKVAQIKSETDVFIATIESPDFKKVYPQIYSILGSHTSEVIKILQIISDFKYEDMVTGEVRLISYLSIGTLTSRLNYSLDKKTSENRVKKVINLMSLTNIILKLSDGDIPDNMLKKLAKSKHDTNYKHRANALEVSGFNDEFMDELQEMCENLLEKDFTLVALSFEYLIRNFGSKEALKVFPQRDLSLPEISKSSLDFETYAVNYITMNIDEKGYVIENDVKEALLNINSSKGFSDYKWKVTRNDLLNKYNLERRRLTKDLKETLKIELPKGKFPVIIKIVD